MKVHLIDGTFELFRAFYGGPSVVRNGREIGATRTFARSLTRFVKNPGVTHLAVAFDTVIESFRNQLFPGYKTGGGIDEALRSQFPLAEKATRALGVVTWSMTEFEADDALATAATRFAEDPRVEEVIICSPDKDFAQCVGPRVIVWDRIRDVRYDEDAVRKKWGIEPASMPDYLALVGDSADGIPGIDKWGAKSSSVVLARYEHLEAIPNRVEAWDVSVRGAKSLCASLESRRGEAMLYRNLATLRREVPLKETLDELAYVGEPQAKLEAFLAKLEGR